MEKAYLVTMPPYLFINDFTHADLVHADFSPIKKKTLEQMTGCNHHVPLDLRFTLRYMKFLIKLEVEEYLAFRLKQISSGFQALFFEALRLACIFKDKIN